MSTPRNVSLIGHLGTFVDLFGSAVAVSSAVRAKRVPNSNDLRTLGIDPVAFRSIGKI